MTDSSTMYDFLDDKEFYLAMQSYRHSGELNQANVCAAYEEVKELIRENCKPSGWQPIETAPKGGEFLLAVWEGSWGNVKKQWRVYHATALRDGLSWAKTYRTEEGGAYHLAGWMPLPEAPKE